jgi:hypothetical protein
MSAQKSLVPSWVRIATGVLALLTLAYGLAGYFDNSLLFPGGTGLDLNNAALKQASDEFAARNFAIGFALAFVTIINGAPEAFTILTIIRALIELQTIVLAFIHDHLQAMLLLPAALLIAEAFMIKTLITVIKKEEQRLEGGLS